MFNCVLIRGNSKLNSRLIKTYGRCNILKIATCLEMSSELNELFMRRSNSSVDCNLMHSDELIKKIPIT